uniref:Uncharacterized protein n=1 Tax=viral metagenome TaxID=1070528 RepID=A0A6M3JAI2_9ZZZZ
MTTTFDAEMYDLAGELGEEFGTAATYVVDTGKTKNANTSTVTGSGTQKTCRTTPPTPVVLRMQDGTTETRTMAVLPRKSSMVSGSAYVDVTFVPGAGDRISYGSDDYTVEDVEALRSGDDVAAWQLVLARS